MLEAIAAMASTLKIATTVEGVETQEQLTRIRALGCSEMQGFIFGRPMPANDAEYLIASEAMECNVA
jgi:EAL domain-containing protein (putative c-di-GMP-specific phosphodiesterase class I)